MALTARDPAWRPASAGEAAEQAGRLRDEFLSQGNSARPVPGATLEGPPPTVADDVLTRPRRRRRPLAIAVLTLAALTCLVLVSVTGFASGARPAGSPSHAPSQAAPAGSTSSPGTVSDTATDPPGQRHHKKAHGNGQ